MLIIMTARTCYLDGACFALHKTVYLARIEYYAMGQYNLGLKETRKHPFHGKIYTQQFVFYYSEVLYRLAKITFCAL